MAPPGNGIFVVRGEMATLMTAMKRSHRWSSASYQEEEQDGLQKQFADLKAQLAPIDDLRLVEPLAFLTPFLDVVRSEETTGPITSLALSTINKFLAYGLVDPTHPHIAATVEAIADAVTHARFVGTDQAADGVVLLKIVQVLRTLMLNPEGSWLTNEAVCEVMLSCFRICFESRLSELLCQTAELALRDIVLLLFVRLPQFAEERSVGGLVRRLKMMAGAQEAAAATGQKKKKTKASSSSSSGSRQPTTATVASKPAAPAVRKSSTASVASTTSSGASNAPSESAAPVPPAAQLLAAPHAPILSTTPATPLGNIVDMQGKMLQTTPLSSTAAATGSTVTAIIGEDDEPKAVETTPLVAPVATVANDNTHTDADVEDAGDDADSIREAEQFSAASSGSAAAAAASEPREDFVNSMGVRFTPVLETEQRTAAAAAAEPYGLPCVRELLRFMVSLCNPLDKQNTDRMTHVGLNLLCVALEVGADHIGSYASLMALVRDDMCRNLFALLQQERLSIFAADLQVCFLLFESLRSDLKFHLECYLQRLFDIVGGDNARVSYEKRELALDNLLQLCRIPGFAAELYINYDCNLYCSDLLEQLVQLLSKNTLSAGGGQQAVWSVHQMSLDALLTIVRGIERNCAAAANANSKESTATTTTTTDAVRKLHGGRHSRNTSTTAGIVLDANGGATHGTAASENDESSSGENNVSSFSSVTAALAADKRPQLVVDAATAAAAASFDTPAQLQLNKQRKLVLTQGTELFNQRPDKGVQFLQDNGFLRAPLDAAEVAQLLRNNAGLDKAMIGEYISKKKNVELRILEHFVASFDFAATRIDLALRQYLEAFRLPGEAPLIFLVMEHFADHWHKCNNEPFANTDSAFRLAYAIIMLNMDQHNHNAKRLNVPMTAEAFARNLRGLNDNADFDQAMLADIFNGIKNEEIIMPAEQTGLVRDNYLWKCMLRRGHTADAHFQHVADAQFDEAIFQLCWGPTLAAISYIFDRTAQPADAGGLAAGARIAAHYARTADFDGLLLTLCKFTGLLSAASTAAAFDHHHHDAAGGHPHAALQPPAAAASVAAAANADITLAVQLAQNPRAQLALQTVFALLHEHADCVREGWRPVLDVCVQLFRARLLPRSLTEVEDFCEPGGRVQLAAEKPPARPADAGLLSSLYSLLASDGSAGRQPTYEEQECIKQARRCVRACHIEQVISDSTFVQFEALQELLAAFGQALRAPTQHKSLGAAYPEEVVVFQMELMVKVLVQNRDRVLPVWQRSRERMYELLAGAANCGYAYLLQRTTVAVLKLAIYLMRNERASSAVLQSLRGLMALRPAVILATSGPIALGIYELLKTSAQNIHTEADWEIVFQLLECVGAGAIPAEADEAVMAGGGGGGRLLHGVARSDGGVSSEDETTTTATLNGLAGGGAVTAVSSDRGYTSDSDLSAARVAAAVATASSSSNQAEHWILVNKAAAVHGHSDGGDNSSSAGSAGSGADCCTTVSAPASPTAVSLTYPCRLLRHSPFALVKCWESLAFIVRNVAHITPYNFESCVKCIRTFVEASLSTADWAQTAKASSSSSSSSGANRRRRADEKHHHHHDADSDEASSNGRRQSPDDELQQRYELIAEQLLDLMHTLHTRTAQIFRWWAEEGGSATTTAVGVAQPTGLWAHGWCPLLQGIARLVTDRRREVRTHAIEFLQRALLVHDLQALSGAEWHSCFRQVIFPLLGELLREQGGREVEPALLDESRIRAATIMWKVFLHHLTPLIQLPAFGELWLEILDFMQRFMAVGSDMLHEAMREGLKNMLLVVNMHPVRVFHSDAALWSATWERIGQFMPQLKDELFRDKSAANQRREAAPDVVPTTTTQPHAQQPPIDAAVASTTSHEPAATDVEIPNEQPPQSHHQQPLILTTVAHNEPPAAQPPQTQQQQQQQHIPYLVDQAQQQFALMEQQYAQQCSEQHVQQQHNSYPSYTLDMGDSESDTSLPNSYLLDTPRGGPVVDTTEQRHHQSPSHYHHHQQLESGAAVADIYSDYVQDPYNLISFESQAPQQQQPRSDVLSAAFHTDVVAEPQPQQQQQQHANVFQSSNYFGAGGAEQQATTTTTKQASDLFGLP